MSPEFRRNLWLELTPHRLVAMPVVLVAVLGLVAAAFPEPRVAVAATAALGACALLIVWGASNAGDAIPEEMRGRTWDAQRMSAIGPWAMAWGKLFGSTAFAWYGGAMCLAVLLVAAPGTWRHPTLEIALLIAAVAVLFQGVACLAGLSLSRKGSTRQSGVSGWILIGAFLFLTPGLSLFGEAGRRVGWWAGSYGLVGFMLATATAFAAWSVFGLYRAMCTELQVRTTPWAFAAFAGFLTAYFAGFLVAAGSGAGGIRDALLACGLLVCAALTYVFLFSEQTGPVVLRRLQVRFARGDRRGALEELPCWVASIALTALFAGIALLFASPADARLGPLLAAALALVLLVVRDAAIYLFFAFAPAPRRVDTAALFYLAMLYGVLPWLLRAAGAGALAEAVLPPLFTKPGVAAVVAAAHCALACWLAAMRWRRLQQSMREAT